MTGSSKPTERDSQAQVESTYLVEEQKYKHADRKTN